MRPSPLFTCSACVAAVAVLCACGSSSSATAGPSVSSSCPYTSDMVRAELPVVQVQVGPNVAQTIGAGTSKPLACGTTLTVAHSGTAQPQFGSQGTCQLWQYGQQPASLTSRDPAGDLLTLHAGHLTCSVNSPISAPSAVRCPYGTVQAHNAQWFEICAQDPVFEVAVFLGSVQVIDLKGNSHTVETGQEIYFDFQTGVFIPTQAKFSSADERFFILQARTSQSGSLAP